MISVNNRNVEMCKLLVDNGALPSINTSNNVNIKSYVIIENCSCLVNYISINLIMYDVFILYILLVCVMYILGWMYTSYDKCS